MSQVRVHFRRRSVFLGGTATEIVDSEHIVSQVRSFCRPATDKFEFVGIIDTQERDQKVKLTWVSPFFLFPSAHRGPFEWPGRVKNGHFCSYPAQLVDR